MRTRDNGGCRTLEEWMYQQLIHCCLTGTWLSVIKCTKENSLLETIKVHCLNGSYRGLLNAAGLSYIEYWMTSFWYTWVATRVLIIQKTTVLLYRETHRYFVKAMNHNFFPERGEGLTDGNCSYYVYKITIRLLVQRTVSFIQCAWFLSYFIKIFNLLRHEEFHFAHITTCGFSFDIYT